VTRWAMSDVPLVPQFRDLVVPDASAHFEELVGEIERRISSPWSRDQETEQSRHLGGRYRVFGRQDTTAGPGVLLFLITRNYDVEIANVVPTGDRHELTMQEYNEAVAEFNDRFLAEAASILGLEVSLSETELDLGQVLDEGTFRALLAFSRASNRATGSSHPSDRQRWLSFIVAAYRTGANLSSGDLQSWLVLDGWSEDVVFDLIVQFEFAMGLLRYVAEH
jgi:hypothetical protein